jgi:hypothetical protein
MWRGERKRYVDRVVKVEDSLRRRSRVPRFGLLVASTLLREG